MLFCKGRKKPTYRQLVKRIKELEASNTRLRRLLFEDDNEFQLYGNSAPYYGNGASYLGHIRDSEADARKWEETQQEIRALITSNQIGAEQ